MRSIWKGSISFGLVSIPIKVVSATESHSVSFHQVHTADGGRIRYRKVCELEEREVPREEIGKGFETGDGTTVQLTDADLAALPLPTAKTVEILGFVPGRTWTRSSSTARTSWPATAVPRPSPTRCCGRR
jgi:DNA end-binding protein Ku